MGVVTHNNNGRNIQMGAVTHNDNDRNNNGQLCILQKHRTSQVSASLLKSDRLKQTSTPQYKWIVILSQNINRYSKTDTQFTYFTCKKCYTYACNKVLIIN